ncbi:MAG: hypothetical protein PUB12_07220, partial [[Clostridium] aminophilum]|uniref:hypothetical protein n=1 Tax=[Clostridium] aminophilum TaxID=1526 RepID=UPI0026F0B86E
IIFFGRAIFAPPFRIFSVFGSFLEIYVLKSGAAVLAGRTPTFPVPPRVTTQDASGKIEALLDTSSSPLRISDNGHAPRHAKTSKAV